MRMLVWFGLSLTAAESLLVVEKHNDSIGFYDLKTGAKQGSVKVGHIPHEFVFSKDGKQVYVTNYGTQRWTDETQGGNTISIVDLAAKRVAGVIDLGEYRRPHGIELGLSGKLYVTTDMPSAVLIVDPLAKRVDRVFRFPPKELPHMLALSRDESRLFTANAGNGRASVIDLKTGAIRSLAVGGVPMGLALTADETSLFVATRTGDSVAEIDIAKWELKRQIKVEGQPVRLVLLPGGKKLLVSLIADGAIVVLELPSGKQANRMTVGLNAEGLHIDAQSGEGYVSAQGEKRVLRFSLADFKRTGVYQTEERPDPILIWRH